MHHNEAAHHQEGEQHMQDGRKVAKHTVRRKWSDSHNGSMRDIYSKDGQAKKESWGEEQHCRGSQMNSHTPPNSNAIDAKLSSGRCPLRNSYVNVLYFKKLKLNKKLFEKMKNKNIVIYLKYKETTCTSKSIKINDSEIANLYLSFLITEPLAKNEKQIIKIYIKYFKDKKYKILSFGFVELNFEEFTEKFYKKKCYMLCYDKNSNKYVFGYFVLLLANQIKWTICNRKISHEFINKSYFVWDRNNYDHQIFYICKKIQSFLLQSVSSRGGSQGHAFQSLALLKHFGVTHSCPGTFRWRKPKQRISAREGTSSRGGEEEAGNFEGGEAQGKTEVCSSEPHGKIAICGSLTRLEDSSPSERSDQAEPSSPDNQDDVIKKGPSKKGLEETDVSGDRVEEPYESNELNELNELNDLNEFNKPNKFNNPNETNPFPTADDMQSENSATDEAEACAPYAAQYDATHCLESITAAGPFSSTEDLNQTMQKGDPPSCSQNSRVEGTNANEESNVEVHSDAYKQSELRETSRFYSHDETQKEEKDETQKAEKDEPRMAETDEPPWENPFDLILREKVENILNNDVDHFVEEVQFILTHLKKRIIKKNEFFCRELKNGYPDVEVVTKDHVAEKGDTKNEEDEDEDIEKKKIPIAHLTNGEKQSEQNCNVQKDILTILQNCVNTTSLYIKSVLKDKHVSKQEKGIFVVYDDIVDNIKKALSQFLQDGTSHEQNLNISRMKSISLGEKKKEKKITKKKSQSDSPQMCTLRKESHVSSEMSIGEGSRDQHKSYIGRHVSTALRHYKDKWKRKLSGARSYV
ncbi:unnamed protein product [Plasmodium vivax]|uniref:Uncharacterized protein n=5 Tax=Plasmodium vivax TaxID=5855 RepID=A5KA57_PLAVS|nr:hypothetical protein, conserved [Plasmodium vivax]KMZ83107.1 hypothetical protein PVIIG_03989 [Plasmodium vivax India VII]KMZ89437.1 hypothetical protein PVBG_03158 [Plasmodium vivax Brazil I]KMZ95800.1 hypothetical protein PVMG_03874 [Plasmodium vivax Mauritania I]EDL43693.1 hypothetical protein, conserved [Plasmodium vivax]CAG9484674.1 unnamed protein product [Plasmodium vivax]|eukprot:XP_001613420.1 hypothetical protein [Plasmodium vivax Sal-1]